MKSTLTNSEVGTTDALQGDVVDMVKGRPDTKTFIQFASLC